jgi:hypothetical protein
MRQRLINFVFIACVGVLILFAVVWAVTFVVGYTGVLAFGGRAVLVDTCRGEISIWTAPVAPAPELRNARPTLINTIYDRAEASTALEWYRTAPMRKRGLFALGAGIVRADSLMPPIGNAVLRGHFGYGVIIPYWLLCTLACIWPATRWYRQQKMDRDYDLYLQGLCPKCGYDLRASPELCPECGARPADIQAK